MSSFDGGSSGSDRQVGNCENGAGSGSKPGDVSLADRVLLWVAARLGPVLDQIDVDPRNDGVRVRDAVIDFCKPGGPSPTDVRGAFLDLVECGALLGFSEEAVGSPDAKVHLRVRGLLAARKLQPDVGRVARIVTLRMKPWKQHGLLAAWMDTGASDRDKRLNDSGVCLAAFYVLAAEEPSKRFPLQLADCSWKFARLARLGVGPKSGPGWRVMPAEESISDALDAMAAVVPIHREQDPDDKRRRQWFLAGAFPEVRIVGVGGIQFEDWAWMRESLRVAIRGQRFPDRQHNEVVPMTDKQCMDLEKETQRKHRRPKGRHKKTTQLRGDREAYREDRTQDRRLGGWGAEASPEP